jgi:ferredoxin-NADP reductase
MKAITTTGIVQGIREESSSVYTLLINPEEPLDFAPGQFCFLYFEREGKMKAKAYSVASLTNDVLEFCIKRVEGGYMSNKLRTLQKGDVVKIGGPYGFFVVEPVERDVIFMATGTGICPMRPMIRKILDEHPKTTITLIFGVRTQEDILYRKEWEVLAQDHTNFNFVPVLSREDWNGEQGHVQDVVEKYWKGDVVDFYVCGLFPMVDEVKALLLEKGVPKERIHSERYV